MNTGEFLKDAGSGCCFILPLLGAAASASETLPSEAYADLNLYPTVGLHHSSLTPPLGQESLISVETAVSSNILVSELQTLDTVVLSLPLHNAEIDWSTSDSQQLTIPFEAISEATVLEATQIEPELFDPKLYKPELSETEQSETSQTEIALSETTAAGSSTFGALMVELRTTDDAIGISTLVKGAEDGQAAIAFDQWLIPFDDVVKALNFTVSIEADGQLTLRSPEMATQVRLESLPTDPELGVMWSINEISKHLGASAEFDRASYSIRFNRTSLQNEASFQPVPTLNDLTYGSLSKTVQGTLNSALAENIQEDSADLANLDEVDTLPLSLDSVTNPLFESESSRLESSIPKTSDLAEQPADLVSVQTTETVGKRDLGKQDLGVLLVGLAIDEITTVEATLVKGRENGEAAIAFDQWLISFDDAMQAIGGDVTVSDDGLFVVRAPGLATVIDPQTLPSDSDIGQAISIATIREDLGIPAVFDLSRYAIKFSPSVINSPTQPDLSWFFGDRSTPQTAATEGLPTVTPSAFSLSSLSQATYLGSSQDGLFSSLSGQISAVGSAFGGSWFARLRQPSLSDYGSWQLNELQYLRQGEQEDYVLGSHPTFWQSRGTGQTYWGATTIRRWGFSAPESRSTGGFNPRTRMQSSHIGRTVTGEAAPGTFVQLTQGINGKVVDETIVNSSGLYRFEDIPASSQLSSQYSNSGYLVKLYAGGQLTSQPEIRSASFTTLPGQLPRGASALIASAGMGHQTQNDQLFGNFSDLKGGVAYRYGISESVTLGAGLVQDESPQLLTEGFYLPEHLPLQAAFSARMDIETGNAEIDANVRYQPTENLKLTFDSDRFSQRLIADWRLSPRFALTAIGDTRDNTLSLEAAAGYRWKGWSSRAIASIDTRQNLRWNLNTTNGAFNLSHRGSEVATYSSMTYKIPSSSSRSVNASRDASRNVSRNVSNHGHELALTYETFSAAAQTIEIPTGETISVGLEAGRLATAEWRYRSQQRTREGRNRWDLSIGYGFNQQDAGLVASASAAIGAGMDFRVRYRDVSIFDESNSFQVSLVSHLSTQNGLGWGRRRQNELRTQGGLLVQPFLDTNANGIQDPDEPLYLDSPELLLSLNHSAVNAYESDITDSGILVPLAPDTYRLDIDPAGLPLDRTAAEMSYAVSVVPGQHTTVAVPLALTYTVSGVVMDENGLAVPGARVEVVGINGDRKVSITNGAGVYYLERLYPEAYVLSVDGQVLDSAQLNLEGEESAFHERDLHLL